MLFVISCFIMCIDACISMYFSELKMKKKTTNKRNSECIEVVKIVSKENSPVVDRYNPQFAFLTDPTDYIQQFQQIPIFRKEQIQIIKCVGAGRYKKVHLVDVHARFGHVCSNREYRNVCMLSIRNNDPTESDEYVQRFKEMHKKELELMFFLRQYCNVLDILGFTPEYDIITEYMNAGDLYDVISDDVQVLKATSFYNRLVFCLQLCKVVSVLHKHKIAHRDIKASNILCSTTFVDGIKVLDKLYMGDFGLCKYYGDKQPTSTICSVLYCPPEVTMKRLLQEHDDYVFTDYTYDVKTIHTDAFKTDIFSLGCVMAELLTGIESFSCVFDYERDRYDSDLQYYKTSSYHYNTICYPIPQKILNESLQQTSRGIIKILKACWQPKAEQRPSIENITCSIENIIKNMK